MKHIYLYVFFLFSVLTLLIIPNISLGQEILNHDTIRIKDRTLWAYKGYIALNPIYYQPGMNLGFINFGSSIDFEFALPELITICAKSSFNLIESDRYYWEKDSYANWNNVQKSNFHELGLYIDLYQQITYKEFTNHVLLRKKRIRKKHLLQVVFNDSTNMNTYDYISIYGKYYEKPVYKKTYQLRFGYLDYTYIHHQDSITNLWVSNVHSNGIFCGISFNKIGLGQSYKHSFFIDMISKIKTTSYPDVTLANKSLNQTGFRIGYFRNSQKKSGVIELGLIPGNNYYIWYAKLTMFSFGFWLSKYPNN